MNDLTEDNPEDLEHGTWERKRLRLIGEPYH